MKTLKGWLTGGTLAAFLICGSTVAKADPGIVYGISDTSCTQKDDTGIVYGKDDGIVYGKSGIVYGLAGIVYGIKGLVFGNEDQPCTADNTKSGLLISD